jgi:hypothetical protein
MTANAAAIHPSGTLLETSYASDDDLSNRWGGRGRIAAATPSSKDPRLAGQQAQCKPALLRHADERDQARQGHACPIGRALRVRPATGLTGRRLQAGLPTSPTTPAPPAPSPTPIPPTAPTPGSWTIESGTVRKSGRVVRAVEPRGIAITIAIGRRGVAISSIAPSRCGTRSPADSE